MAIGNGTGVEIDGGASGNLIGTDTTGTMAIGNVISGNTGDGVEISGSGTTGNLVEGNLIGTDLMGTMAIANASDGVEVANGATGNTIGGTTTAARNTIARSGFAGVEFDTGAAGNVVEGDYIGTDVTGTVSLGNSTGLWISTAHNTIGGTASGAGNVIAGNDGTDSFWAGNQVLISGFNANDDPADNVVEGNLIGLNADGQAIAGATNSGVWLNFNNGIPTGNTIGGTTAAARNVISGNLGGVEMDGDVGDVVEGNYVGTDVSGTAAIGNGSGSGVTLEDAADNTIGGSVAGAGNVVSGNRGNGIYILDPGAADNLIEGNHIGTDAMGTVALYNGLNEVLLADTAGGNTIGGATSVPGTGAGNRILGGSNNGIAVDGEVAADTIVGNVISVHGNGVYLGNDVAGQIGGPSPQDQNVISSVSIQSSSNVLVEGNLIGTDVAGTVAGPYAYGLGIDSSTGVTIGGTTAGAGNVISGNSGDGVDIVSGGSNLIAGNWIGTDAMGTTALANGGDGVYLSQSSGNTIGGTVLAATNLISGNTNGVEISDSGENLVQGNMIGTDTNGTMAIGNSGAGVLVDGASSDNTIGGPVGGARNLISGNAEGVMVEDGDPTGTLVAGNLIGTDMKGTSNVPNLTGGIIITGGSGTTIGGAALWDAT